MKKKQIKKKKNMNFWSFLTSFYSNPDMTICNFLTSVYSFCGGEHTDTNIWSILSFLVTQGVAKIQP